MLFPPTELEHSLYGRWMKTLVTLLPVHIAYSQELKSSPSNEPKSLGRFLCVVL